MTDKEYAAPEIVSESVFETLAAGCTFINDSGGEECWTSVNGVNGNSA